MGRDCSEHRMPVADRHGRIVPINVRAAGITPGDRDAAALADSEERFRTLADNIAPLAWVADPCGLVVWFNKRWYEFTGTSFEELQGRGWLRLLHPQHRNKVARSIRHALEAGTDWDDLFPMRGRNREYRWFLSRAVPVRDVRGNVVRWIGTNTDVTRQHVAEEALQTANEQLQQADHRINDFLGVLSHDLRSPLAPIQDSLRILDGAPAGSPLARAAREDISRQIMRMTRLVDDLSDAARMSRGAIQLCIERLNLAEVVQRTADDHRDLFAARQIELDVRRDPEPLYVEGDESRLAQIVGILLANAAKFTEQGGRVDLSIERVQTDALIRVADTGVGIPAELLPALFEPCVPGHGTLERTSGGLGLGLALVKGLVRLHGGAVRAHSDGAGTGARFVVTLPLASGMGTQHAR